MLPGAAVAMPHGSMENVPGRLLSAIADVTIGTAIVLVHILLADRTRLRERTTRQPSTASRARA